MLMNILSHFLFAMLIFVPLEALAPRRRDQKILRQLWQTDTAYALFAGTLIAAGMTALFLGTQAIFAPLVGEPIRNAIAAQPLVLQVIEIVVIADVGYYLIHRAFHAVPALWRIHAVHHSIEDMDWLAAYRVHPVDQIMTRGVSLMIPIILGFSPAAFAIFGFFFSWHSVLKHSNVKVSFGPLRWLLATPTYHHWHHANQAEAFDKNFAGQLPIIDLLFGTAIMKEKEGPAAYGTDQPLPRDFVDQLIQPLRPVAHAEPAQPVR